MPLDLSIVANIGRQVKGLLRGPDYRAYDYMMTRSASPAARKYDGGRRSAKDPAR